ncbi:centrosomal and chromosomal factor-like [Agrilus planipennis]|uniref:Centrosomal and chromosomal factor-like n=1 Tax=Agrilus planipennis TaxID=224129 RepID=A0A1W4XEX5_AGRPL|nr:centrosomal and chromosomal factor-like [Agrilus planipennis]
MSSIRGIDAFADGPMMMMMSSASASAPTAASAADASISYPHHHYDDRQWRQHHQQQAVATTPQSHRRQSRADCRSELTDMTACYTSYELVPPSATPAAITATAAMVQQQQQQTTTIVGGRTPTQPSALVQQTTPVVQKDYSLPLHVDCSVEYELPNQAKPPAGVRNEPLLMIHPCYFRKIESQRRSPFINNLPTKQTPASKRRMAKIQQINNQLQQHLHQQQQQQQMPQPAVAQFPMHPQRPPQQQMWDPMPPLVPISAAAAVQQSCCKRDISGCNAYSSGSADSGHWTDPDRSPDRPDNKHIFSGKYRQYLRAHRLQPYMTSEFPIASTFPQIQQVCYNV